GCLGQSTKQSWELAQRLVLAVTPSPSGQELEMRVFVFLRRREPLFRPAVKTCPAVAVYGDTPREIDHGPCPLDTVIITASYESNAARQRTGRENRRRIKIILHLRDKVHATVEVHVLTSARRYDRTVSHDGLQIS